MNLPWKQISTAPAPKDQSWWENFSTKILHHYRKYFLREAIKCVFFSWFFCFSPNADRNFVFFCINSKESEEAKNFFFIIFEQFFAELWQLKSFERPFCYKISKMQWNFFLKKVLFIHKSLCNIKIKIRCFSFRPSD